MNRMPLLSILFLSSFILYGCATTYGPHGLTGGYKEREIAHNQYIVSFFGNGHTSGQQVWNFWIYRCAELTLEKGFEFFELEPSDEHAFLQTPSGENLTVFTMLGEDELALNSKPEALPVYYTYSTVTTYSSKAIVTMYESPVPEEAGFLLDAGVIKELLSPYVKSDAQSSPPEKKDLMVRAAVEAAIRAKRIREDQADLLRMKLEREL